MTTISPTRSLLAIGVAALFLVPGQAGAQAQVRCGGQIATIIRGPGPDTITGTAGRDVIVAGGGNDRVSAGPGDDLVCLGDGNDSLNGGAGDDVLFVEEALDGADSFAGGTGVDTARYITRASSLAVSLDNRPDDGTGDEGDNIHADVENVDGSAGSNTLRGSAEDNLLRGGSALDVIESGSGDDILRGGAGNDIFVPGPGDDSVSGGDGDDRLAADDRPDGADEYLGGSGHDVMSYAARTTTIQVFVDGRANDGAPGEGDNVGAGNDVDEVIGGSGDDRFNARAFFGGLVLQGRAGDDSFTTTNGVRDRLDGGSGSDRCLADPVDVRVSCEG
jgi:Ca2+-binding RTX toxin-like protein